MVEIISKLFNGEALEVSLVKQFVKYAFTINNPGVPYDEAITQKAFDYGEIGTIINGYLTMIRQDPQKFNLSVMTLVKNGAPIKTYVSELPSENLCNNGKQD